MNPLTIMIADDHQLIRNVWNMIISSDQRFSVVAQCSNGEEAIRAAKELRPDIALLDINMTPIDGFEATTQIRRFSPLTRIVAVSMYTQASYVKKMFRLGASGYVSKNSSYHELVNAILTVSEGERFVCEEIQAILAKQENDDQKRWVHLLTPRELELMKYIREGLSSKDIAARINISMKTVELHRHHILRKLNVKNRAELVNYMNAHGIDM